MRVLPKNPLLRLLAVNALAGAAVAGLFVATLFATNAVGIGRLIGQSDAPVLVTIVLYCALVVTFSSVAMGTAVMRLGNKPEESKPGGGHRARQLAPVYVRSSASTPR